MKVFVTKYALTQGIEEEEARDVKDGMVQLTRHKFPVYMHGEGKQWHRTRESAIATAEKMRLKKIELLKKQIQKLEALTF